MRVLTGCIVIIIALGFVSLPAQEQTPQQRIESLEKELAQADQMIGEQTRMIKMLDQIARSRDQQNRQLSAIIVELSKAKSQDEIKEVLDKNNIQLPEENKKE